MSVSTKTAAVMQFFSRGIPLAGTLQGHRLLRHESTPRRFVFAVLFHMTLEHLADETRDAHLAFGRFTPRPIGGPFGEGDGDVFHSRIIHEVRVFMHLKLM